MSELVATIEKNATDQIRVELGEFNGFQLVNVRVWVRSRQQSDAFVPTKAGVALKVALLPELIRALQEAEAQARKLGLL